MKIAIRVLITLLVFGAAFGALEYLASERVEVVTLHTMDAEGQPKDTHIWVLDYAGKTYIRTSQGSKWYARLVTRPQFELTRGSNRRSYTALPRPELKQALNAAYRAKYGWGDAFISALVGGRDTAIILELVPVQASS